MCDQPQCHNFSSCITRNRPETRDITSCLLTSDSDDSEVVVSKCIVEYAALQGMVQMCNVAGQEGAIGYICKHKDLLGLLTKFGTSYMLQKPRKS